MSLFPPWLEQAFQAVNPVSFGESIGEKVASFITPVTPTSVQDIINSSPASAPPSPLTTMSVQPIRASAAVPGPPQRRQSYARLYSLSAASAALNSAPTAGEANISGAIIEFPAMPEVIKLAREVVYNNLVPTQTTPDGIWLYQHTEPLSIPITFKISAWDDEYCNDGPISLLWLAARLHAFSLPVYSTFPSTPAPLAANASGSGASENAQMSQAVQTARAQANTSDTTGLAPVAPPVAVLKLISGGANNPGISCRGFVRNVEVSLLGPWLNFPGGGSASSDVYNLPSAAEFSFTFVHCPSYTNVPTGASFEQTRTAQIFAPDVIQSLYNDLVRSNGISVLGIGQTGAGQVTSSTN